MARNIPMPAVIPACSDFGIDKINQLLAFDSEKKKNKTEDMKTAASACCQLNPWPKTTT